MEISQNSLFCKTRSRIIEEIIEDTHQAVGNFVIVVDRKSLGILSGSCRIFDLTSRGAVVIESLDKPRKPLPHLDSLYFISAKSSSLDSLIQDFSEDALYRSAHVYLTGHFSEAKMKKLATSKALPYIKVFKEANCGYRIVGTDHFSLESPGLLGPLFMARSSNERKVIVNHMARELAAVCGVLNDFPYVCYQSCSLVSQELALAVEDHLEALYRNVPQAKINENRPLLVVLDRSFDLTACFVHDVHYEALFKDLFEVAADGVVRYTSLDNSNVTSQKEAVINEFDDLWTLLRYFEIDEAQQVLNQELNNFRARNKEVEEAKHLEGSHSLKTMAKVVSGLAEYNEKVSQFACHRFCIESSLKSFTSEGLTEVCEIEQALLTGFDVEKNTYKESDLLQKALQSIQNLQNKNEKLRLAMMILCSMQLSESDRQALINEVPPGLTLNLPKLSNLGINLQTSEKSKKRQTKQYISDLKKRIPGITKIFNYAVLKLADIITAATCNKLESIGFRYSRQAPPDQGDSDPPVKSLRKKGNPVKAKRRVIIFILGGVCHSELRLSHDFKETQVIIGGSSVFSPLEFVQEIIEMNRDAVPDDIEPEEILLDFS
jgi:hypothetical protein